MKIPLVHVSQLSTFSFGIVSTCRFKILRECVCEFIRFSDQFCKGSNSRHIENEICCRIIRIFCCQSSSSPSCRCPENKCSNGRCKTICLFLDAGAIKHGDNPLRTQEHTCIKHEIFSGATTRTPPKYKFINGVVATSLRRIVNIYTNIWNSSMLLGATLSIH